MKKTKTLIITLFTLLMLTVANIANSAVIESVSWNGSDYKLEDANTWELSEAEAQTLGGHLVTVNSEAEHDFLWGLWGIGDT